MPICSSCYEECEEVTIKDGFSYDYGSITNAWHDQSYEGSDCCGEEVYEEGKCYLDKTSYHVAKKDHVKNGRIIVPKGCRYKYRILKAYYVDNTGERHGAVEINKFPVDENNQKIPYSVMQERYSNYMEKVDVS